MSGKGYGLVQRKSIRSDTNKELIELIHRKTGQIFLLNHVHKNKYVCPQISGDKPLPFRVIETLTAMYLTNGFKL